MSKDEIMKCGFCNNEIEQYKHLVKYRKRTGNKTVLLCPYCKAILGIYRY